jgi:serine/threonine protein kinase
VRKQRADVCVVSLLFSHVSVSLAAVVMPNEPLVPVRWASPEVLTAGVYSYASDIWAYGVVLWEIFSNGKTPFGECECECV